MFADSHIRYFGARGKDGIGKRGAKFRTTPDKDEALMPALSPQDLKAGMLAQGMGGQVIPPVSRSGLISAKTGSLFLGHESRDEWFSNASS